MAKAHEAINANVSTGSVIGTYTGKCCDAAIMNNNDMHLGRKLFENLKASDEYKRAMENHHYIGYLGHPEDPDCQDYKNACIVMKDMRILDNDEIEGDFDLVNTPVGLIVKSFIDAGVNFGISIRGLGDVDASGEVDPDEFIFRGFDLVTFPAYDDCIPEFKAIAASTDVKKKAAYKKICACIDTQIPSISSPTTLGLIQEQFDEGSAEFNKIQDQIDALDNKTDEDDTNLELAVAEEKLEAMTELYLDAAEKARTLAQDLADSETANIELTVECNTAKQKFARYKRIVANQLNTAQSTCEDLEDENTKLSNKYANTQSKLREVKAALKVAQNDLESVSQNYAKERKTNSRLREINQSLKADRDADKKSIEASNNMNLKYQQKIEANSETISQKDSAIEDLKAKLHETVVANRRLESEASNLDDKCNELRSRVEAAEEMVFSYQQAYANMYANALGVYLSDVPITATTSVEDLKQMIKAGTLSANIPAGPGVYNPAEPNNGEDESELFDDLDFNAGMVSM